MESTLAEDILDWIIKRNITIIPAPINPCYFHPYRYSVGHMTQLKQKGFNSFVWLYSYNEQTKKHIPNQLTEHAAKTNIADFWYILEESKCEPTCSKNCRDKKAKFIYSSECWIATTDRL